jgi:phosphoribosylformimino-5-aminoimidazole carboxamide ribotide isomerase
LNLDGDGAVSFLLTSCWASDDCDSTEQAATDMIVMPAMDLRDGGCVHPGGAAPLGDRHSRMTDALSVARGWAQAGFRQLHVIDLDAAMNLGSNARVIEEIILDGSVEVQVGGGVRSTEHVQRLFEAGATRIVVGSRAVEEPEWLGDLADLFPSVIVLAADVRERRLMTHGRMRSPPLDLLDVVSELAGLPLGGVLVTAVHLGQSMEGRDLNLLEDVADTCECPVFTAGGVTAVSDLRALEHRGVAGVVIGTALSTGALDARTIAQEFGE